MDLGLLAAELKRRRVIRAVVVWGVVAFAAARKATELDPLNWFYWTNFALHHVNAGDLESARAAVARAFEISPDNPGIYSMRGIVQFLAGSPDAALRDFQRVPQEGYRLRWAAIINHDLGRAKESDAALDALVAGYGSQRAFQVAQVHAWRGERDLAFEWLQRAYDARSISMMFIKSTPLLRKLRDDPRYVALLKKMNFPMD